SRAPSHRLGISNTYTPSLTPAVFVLVLRRNSVGPFQKACPWPPVVQSSGDVPLPCAPSGTRRQLFEAGPVHGKCVRRASERRCNKLRRTISEPRITNSLVP